MAPALRVHLGRLVADRLVPDRLVHGRLVSGCLVLACLLQGSPGAHAETSDPEPGRDALVVLQYHFVSEDTPRSTSVTPEELEGHLDLLEREAFTVVDLADALATLQSGGTLPQRAAAITFDDGYRSVHTEARPRLVAREMPFTVFVNPGPVDAGSRLHADWDELRELQAAGARIANHGMRHAFLARRDPRLPPETDAAFEDRMRAEITSAQTRLEEELGVSERLFAYPYGEYDDRIRAWLEREGYIGIGQHSGVVWSGSDFRALPRFPFSGNYADAEGFVEKLHMGPLPVLDATELDDPTRATEDVRPELAFEVAAAGVRASTLACYATRQGRIEVRSQALDEARLQVRARAGEALPLGRSRYNCTARSPAGDWLWFSQPWLRLGPDGEAPQ